jgi:enolase-phosphatase E1
MTLSDNPVRCILLDIEGTTTPLDFVHKVLFPYARERAKDYLARNWFSAEVQENLAKLSGEQDADTRQGLNPPAIKHDSFAEQLESTIAYIHWLMDRDRKSTPLKSLQGKIWEEGYLSGLLNAPVFDDVVPAFARWRRQNQLICIYSSGSVLAQRLLFSHTTAGDLTNYISNYFDTVVGKKGDMASYLRIADEVGLDPADLVFISDSIAELDAAHSAGLRTLLAVRPGNHPVAFSESHPTITTFAAVPGLLSDATG